MSNLIQHHERLYQFIKHKERSSTIFKVLKAKPVVETRSRSKSMPGRPRISLQKRDEEIKIQEENERLLKSLLKISERKSKYV
uniref:Transposase n=1 Tax=Loa loa TaxID=7209 RepID=A0A1I7VYB3_LOALO